jgi:hypothetical protein
VPRVGVPEETRTVSKDYATLVRRVALAYVSQFGEDAVEIIREQCIHAHKSGKRVAFNAWRDVGVVADDILLARERVRRAASL